MCLVQVSIESLHARKFLYLAVFSADGADSAHSLVDVLFDSLIGVVDAQARVSDSVGVDVGGGVTGDKDLLNGLIAVRAVVGAEFELGLQCTVPAGVVLTR